MQLLSLTFVTSLKLSNFNKKKKILKLRINGKRDHSFMYAWINSFYKLLLHASDMPGAMEYSGTEKNQEDIYVVILNY